MVRAPGEWFVRSLAKSFANPKLVAFLGILLLSSQLSAPLAAQDSTPESAAADLPCASTQSAAVAAPPNVQPGHTASAAAPTLAADCLLATPAAPPQVSQYLSSYSSSKALSTASYSQDADSTTLFNPKHQPPVSTKVGKWGGEQWEPAILQALEFTWIQNGYRYATEEKTRRAIDQETWHRYWLAVSGLHTWSDGGKTWTVYVAHPVQGAIYSDIWTEHDPHGVLVPFGTSHAYWASRIKAFWWNAAWELQWKFGPFSEASIGNVGLVPGKLGANTIVSTATIGTGLAIGEDMLDHYWISHWEKKTDNRAIRGLLRSLLNPDRSFANILRRKYPWYRDRRPTLRDLEPE